VIDMDRESGSMDNDLQFVLASPGDARIVAGLVLRLTAEISRRMSTQSFDLGIDETVARCEEFLVAGHYAAIIGFAHDTAIAVATLTETHALYAGGKMGVIQEFYVTPEYRSAGVGAKLIAAVREHGQRHGWACIELCTPPLPEFERTLQFYQANGLSPVGGRKMRQAMQRTTNNNE
jgi:GNAT superfamily N-acetyltransferase